MLCTFKILLIVLVLASSGLIQRDQPREFTAVLQRLGMPQQHLLIPCESHTVFTTIHFTRENYAVPSTQGWSRCQYCGLRDDERVVMFNANGELHKSVLLSWSLWGEFFHKHKNDRIEAIYDENFEAYYRIDRPVFVLPLITLHVGHILVDLLEQLYHAHMEHYGEIRKDCVIILDVASESERAVLREKIYYSINSDNRSVGALLRQFTDLPIFSIDLWKELSTWNNIVFSDLHVGLDISLSHFNAGQHSQPCIMSLTHVSTANFALVQRYQKFARFLRQSVDFAAETDTKHETVQVTMIQRKKNRVINNIEDILRVSQRPGLATAICDLDTMDYQQQQRTLLWNTDILVSVAGTALHNVLFMRPGSAVVMFMQPHWCEYAWMFANQAVLLGIKPFVYCTPASPVFVVDNSLTNFLAKDIKLASWTRQMWLQGPRHYKSDNVTVGLSEYAILLDQAVAHVREQIKSAPNLFKKEDFRTGEPHNAARSLQALSCPFPIEKKPTKTGKLTGNVESSTGAEQHGSNFPARRMHRALEIYISSLTAEYVPASVGWKVGIVGEVGIADAQFSALLESLPRLAICMESVDMAPWCHPVAAFNYYTDLFLTMEAPVQALHVWAQATSSGAKLRHSDVYVVLDCRLPEAGFALHREIVGSDISFEVTLSEDCVPSNVRAAGGLGALRAQVLTYPTSKFGTTKQSCRTSRRLLFQNKMHSRLSLQRFTADFCWLHALTAANCVDFITHLQQHILRVRAAAARGLPPVQHEPSPVNPFHFLHIEKTAGSTLRE